MKTLALAAIAALAGTAHAEPVDPRDEDVALGATIAGTVGAGVLLGIAGGHTSAEWRPAAVELAAAVIAPTFGHVYAGDYLSPGLGLRVAGAGLLALGVYDWSLPYHTSSPTLEFSPVGGWLILGGIAAFTTGTIYDIATSRREARRYNREHAMVVPMPMATPDGPAAGMGLAGRF